MSLAGARQQREGIRKLLARNINPAQQRIFGHGITTFDYLADSLFLIRE